MRDFSQNKDYNKVEVDGMVFSHDLSARTTGPQSKNPGTEYISGTVNIATDDEDLSVVPVNFGYVTKYYKNGNESETYKLLMRLIQENKTINAVGRDHAMIVRVQGDIECNTFVARNGDVVAQQRIRGSFIHEGSRGDGLAEFNADMLISSYAEREVDDGDNYGIIKGYVFNFRNDFLPVTFNVRIKDGMKYFESQDISSANPLLTHVWGDIVTSTVQVETGGESAFGTVRTTSRSFRSWDIAGASGNPYEYGEESVMTIDDVKAGLAAREEYIAEVKKNHDDRQKAQGGATAFASDSKKSTKSKSSTAGADFLF